MSKNGSVLSHYIWSSVALTFILCWISTVLHTSVCCVVLHVLILWCSCSFLCHLLYWYFGVY